VLTDGEFFCIIYPLHKGYMAHKLAQTHKNLQKMTLTPHMKHSIQLLRMSGSDLTEYIETVLASNPFLEKEKIKKLLNLNKDQAKRQSNMVEGQDSMDTLAVGQRESLRESLLSQLRILGLNAGDRAIAEYLVFEIGESGYLETDIAEVASEFLVETEAVENVLEKIQNLDPPGVGARDVKECLLMQLKRMGKEDSLEFILVGKFLSDIAINDVPKISKALSADKEAVKQAVKKIKLLNPKPGNVFSDNVVKNDIPDLIATVTGEKVRLELNRESIPRLRLYNPYKDKFDVIKDPEARKFLKENVEVAKGLIDSIKRREETMCRVANYILEIQKEQIREGHAGVKTLTIQDIASALSLHPSTISRTVSEKCIEINGKLLSLDKLLSHGFKKQNGDMTSKAVIKKRIKDLIDAEDKQVPLSDRRVQERLEKEGISLKRRTVGKYRESMRILPTHLRKKIKEI